MKYKILIKTIITFIILLTILMNESAYTKDISVDEFIIGRIDFIGKGGREGIVVQNSQSKSYLLNMGVLLYIKRGNEQIVLKINDADGKYLRCVINSETVTKVINSSNMSSKKNSGRVNETIKEGEDVYYSETINNSIKYSDAKRILASLIKLYENFILKIESTEDTRILSVAVKNFSIELDKILPEVQRINNKYPELDKFNLSPPTELQNESAMLEVLEPRLKEAFFKIKMFSTNEDVKKATEDLQKVLTKMNAGK